MSASIMAAKGPGPSPTSSTILNPCNGPAICVPPTSRAGAAARRSWPRRGSGHQRGQVLGDGEARRRRRGRGIAHDDETPVGINGEVVDQTPASIDGLGSHPGAGGQQIAVADGGYVGPGRGGEGVGATASWSARSVRYASAVGPGATTRATARARPWPGDRRRTSDTLRGPGPGPRWARPARRRRCGGSGGSPGTGNGGQAPGTPFPAPGGRRRGRGGGTAPGTA